MAEDNKQDVVLDTQIEDMTEMDAVDCSDLKGTDPGSLPGNCTTDEMTDQKQFVMDGAFQRIPSPIPGYFVPGGAAGFPHGAETFASPKDILEYMAAQSQASFPAHYNPYPQGFPPHMMSQTRAPFHGQPYFPPIPFQQQMMMHGGEISHHPQLPMSKEVEEKALVQSQGFPADYQYQPYMFDETQPHMMDGIQPYMMDGIQPYMGDVAVPKGSAPTIKVYNLNKCGNMNLNLGTGETSSTCTPLGNIIDSTRELIKHYDASSLVSTYAERDALKKLKDRGCLFIKGRAGTGKTCIGVHIIDTVAKEKKRIPIYLTSALDWNLIPKFQPQGEKGKGDKYVVMVDDIFGTSGLVQSTLDEWEKMFEFMWPSVESGQICLVLTSRSDISSRCQFRVQKYSIMKNIQTVELDEGKFCLRPNEKRNLIQKYCGRLPLTKEDIEELCQLKTHLGFPQCCVNFAKNKTAKDGKSGSLGPAYFFLAADLYTLKENDPVGYFVLLLILMKGGLDVRKLERPTNEFKSEIYELTDICMSFDDGTPNCRMIKDKAIHFCGIYLSKSGNEIRFRHQSIYNAVFLEVASMHLDLFLDKCPAETLVEFVRTRQPGISRDEGTFVYVEGDLYGEFTRRVIQILLGEDGGTILDHPCFRDTKFVDVLLNKTDMDARIQIATKNIGRNSLDLEVFDLSLVSNLSTKNVEKFSKISTIISTKEDIFRYDYQISLMVLKGLSYLAVSLLFLAGTKELPGAILKEALNCAIYKNDCQIVSKLLERRVYPSAKSIYALCCVQNPDQKMTEEIFSQMELDPTCDMARMLSLAVQNGNTQVVSLLVGMLENTRDNMRIFSNCLTQLMLQCSRHIPDNSEWISANATSATEILNTLLNTSCEYDHFILLYLAAGHENPYALKRLLEVPVCNLDSSQSLECLKQACLSGSFQCLEVCVQHETLRISDGLNTHKGMLLNCCARSAKDSHLKMKILLEQTGEEGLGVNISDERGNTPLHFAALRGDAECVKELVNAEADASVENEMGISPLECAAVSNNTECLQIILGSDQTVDKERPVFKYCFHDLSRTLVYESFQSQYPDLKCSRSSEDEKDIRNNIGILIKSKFNVDKIDSDGQTCIFKACHTSSPAALKFLCGKTNMEFLDTKGRTILHEAAQFGSTAMVRFLCERYTKGKAKVTANNGETVVHAAAASHREAAEKLQYLIEEKKAPLDDDESGRSALFPAVERGDEEIMDYLVEKGLRLTKKDKNGTTLLQIAEKHNHENLKKRLQYRRLSSNE